MPYYAAAGVWLLYALLFPLYRPAHFLIVAFASAAVFLVMRAVCGTVTEQVPDKPAQPETTGNAELDKMIREGAAAIEQMKRLNASIQDPKLSAEIDRLEDVCGKIFDRVKEDPSRLPQIRKFMDYYLPTTIKILGAYERMGAQGVSGENISSTMTRVENMMGTIVGAFEKQLDALFGAEAMDISTDITVLENLMQREGLVTDELHESVSGGTATATAAEGDIKLEL